MAARLTNPNTGKTCMVAAKDLEKLMPAQLKNGLAADALPGQLQGDICPSAMVDQVAPRVARMPVSQSKQAGLGLAVWAGGCIVGAIVTEATTGIDFFPSDKGGVLVQVGDSQLSKPTAFIIGTAGLICAPVTITATAMGAAIVTVFMLGKAGSLR